MRGHGSSPRALQPEPRGTEASGSPGWSSACRLDHRPPGAGAAGVKPPSAAGRRGRGAAPRGFSAGCPALSSRGTERRNEGHRSANLEFAHRCHCHCLFLEASASARGQDKLSVPGEEIQDQRRPAPGTPSSLPAARGA